MTVATSAIAMASEITFDQELFEAWGLGGVEFYAEIGGIATVSDALACELNTICDFLGVWEYEVDEPLGRYIEHVFRTDIENPYAAIKHELGRLAIDFLGNGGAVDVMRGAPIIHKHTGYNGV